MFPVLGRADGWFNRLIITLKLLVYIIKVDYKILSRYVCTMRLLFCKDATFFKMWQCFQRLYVPLAEVVRSNITLSTAINLKVDSQIKTR